MSRMIDSIDTVNNLIRTVLAVVVVSVLGTASWFGYSTYTAGERSVQELENAKAQLVERDAKLAALDEQLVVKSREIAKKDAELQEKDEEISTLHVEIEEKQKEIDWLDTALRLIKVTHRVARLRVVDQTLDDQTGRTVTVVEFAEVNDSGQPLEEPRQYRLKGDVVFIDSWIVKFDDHYIEHADQDRSTSLCLFRRIFGEFQEPSEGFELDRQGVRPTGYARGGRMSEFEQRIWDDFWEIANDAARAKEMGIRAAHGNAISIKARQGKTYRITLRASGDLSFVPEDDPPKPIEPPT